MNVNEILNFDSYTDAMFGQKKVKIKIGDENTLLSFLSDDIVVIPREHFDQLAKEAESWNRMVKTTWKFSRYLDILLKRTDTKIK